ncbi:LysR family transcriptional regulator [Oscillatoria sp. FACHB-1407]|uniref:LysR family transcriptional regulator n=1 Tax=Oscillatoria sp. FACHB-1407 TaxID=2692847 RepID=UPI00168858FD|nr:LysR family transcriptional regulator [Oscillatoria sp. FACHB-1407]MBD2463656.1 LysR family transcriptional regulator [Oscillatoria sp. FACHB-1407]
MLNVLNQLPELIAFVESVECNSFSAAARSLDTTPSAISKRVAKLEDRLGVRLLQRTTRSLSLTAEGAAYYERVSRLLRELDDANDLVISRGKPRGKLTVSTSLDFGQWLLVQSIPEFLAQYPEIQIDLRLSDRVVDLVTEGIDVAIRLGNLEDSRLMVRPLGQTQFVLCAAPSYLETHGIPTTPNDLMQHNCLQYMFQGRPEPWLFWIDQEWQTVPVKGSFYSDNGGALKNAAIAGLGITQVLGFQIKQEVEQGQLILLLPNQISPGLPVHALFTHQRNLSPRVRVFLEFLNSYCRQFLGKMEKNLKKMA